MATEAKITYATLTADNQELNAKFDAAISQVKGALGKTYPLYIDGKARPTQATTESLSPIDTRTVVARVASGTVEDVRDAVAAAKAAYPGWRHTPWQKRNEILTRAARTIRDRRFELSAWLIYEMGKNRIEALGEIEETADLIDYYIEQMRANDGYVHPMGKLSPADTNTSALRPFGVWGVIAPWNFPYALIGAPIAAALITGNTVVAKPSSDTPLSGVLLAEILQEAGLPPGTFNLLTGSGRVVGNTLIEHPDLAGLTFTGSFDVGFHQLFQKFSRQYPKPCIVEMGGKNPAIVMDSADLDRAALGVFRSAFGMNGHKCSACSRVYVHQKVADAFLDKLREADRGGAHRRSPRQAKLPGTAGHEVQPRRLPALHRAGPGHPGREDPDRRRAVDRGGPGPRLLRPPHHPHRPAPRPRAVADRAVRPHPGRRGGGQPGSGAGAGQRHPVRPDRRLLRAKQEEIDAFLERIEAGVVYVNRAAGATTGAWPGVQPFGGWKGSGSSGKNIGGLYTLPCYLREQSRTLVS